MADKPVTNAKNYAGQIRYLMKSVSNALPDFESVRENIEIQADKLIRKSVFADEILHQARYETGRIQDEKVLQFIAALSSWADLLPHYQKLVDYNTEIAPKLKNLLAQMQPATSNLLWLISSADKRSAAVRAFNEINERTNDLKSLTTIAEAAKTIKNYNSLSTAEAISKFYQNPVPFKKAFLSLNLQKHSTEVIIPELEEAIALLAPILSKYTGVMEGKDQLAKQIRKQAEQVAAEEVLAQLQKIDISAINYERKGIRFKALYDHNFRTLADIYGTSLIHLVSVPGISYETAEMLKESAQHYADEIGKSYKIRLSNDHKTKSITALLECVSEYVRKRRSISYVEGLFNKHTAILVREYGYLHSIPQDVLFLFTSVADKANALQACKDIRQFAQTSDYFELKKSLEQAAVPASLPVDVWSDFNSNTVSYLNVLEALVPNLFGSGSSYYGLPEELAKEIQEEQFFPDGLKCELFPYQTLGIKYILHQGKVLLGDEMGLGKTVQAIGTMVSLKYTGASHFLVICPASVLANWCKEVTKFSKLRVIQIYGRSRKSAFRTWMQSGGVGITTYETCAFLSFENQFKFNLLIVDEAHYIKNPEAKRSINTRNIALHAERLLFMTGTPLENRVEEMVELIDVLRPEIANEIAPLGSLPNAPFFREKIAPVYYRRKRDDVLTELPDLIVKDEWCSLTEEENLVYEKNVLNRNWMEMRQLSWNSHHSSKAERLKEIVDEAGANGYKTLVFSFFLETGKKVQETLGSRCMPTITGSMPPNKRQDVIDRFNAAPAGTVLVAQIQAGGTGLNIQTASVVIICEPQLKPSIEDQAISRAYRFGQHNTVFVYRLLSPDTCDEKINDMLNVKRTEFKAFADDSVAAANMGKELEIDKESVNKIIQEEIDRINAKGGSTTVGDDHVEPFETSWEMPGKPKETKPPKTPHQKPQPGFGPRPTGTVFPQDRPAPGNISGTHSSKPAPESHTSSWNHGASIPESVPHETVHETQPGRGTNSAPGHTTGHDPDSHGGKAGKNYASLQEFIYMVERAGFEYKDSTLKGGCFWVKSTPESDPVIRNTQIAGTKLRYAKSAKAFKGESGWYYSL